MFKVDEVFSGQFQAPLADMPILTHWADQRMGDRKICARKGCDRDFYTCGSGRLCDIHHKPVFRRCTKCNSRLMQRRIRICPTCSGRETV